MKLLHTWNLLSFQDYKRYFSAPKNNIFPKSVRCHPDEHEECVFLVDFVQLTASFIKYVGRNQGIKAESPDKGQTYNKENQKRDKHTKWERKRNRESEMKRSDLGRASWKCRSRNSRKTLNVSRVKWQSERRSYSLEHNSKTTLFFYRKYVFSRKIFPWKKV